MTPSRTYGILMLLAATATAQLALEADFEHGPLLQRASIANLWTRAPMTDRNLATNHSLGHWLVPSNRSELQLLGWHVQSPYTNPLVSSMSTVRILGGWSPSDDPPNELGWPDVVWREGGANGSGIVHYRWDAFFDRLDPMMKLGGIDPVIVLDNVPYALAGRASTFGKYGQTAGPRNTIKDYHTMLVELAHQVVQRYGLREVQQRVRWRVATEPNTRPGHWSDTTQEWMDMYDAAADAITSVLPSAIIGPGNFCPFIATLGCKGTGPTVVEPIVDHIANGTNTWTNKTGQTPISFLSSSFYGGWRGEPGSPEGPLGYDPSSAGEEAQALRSLQARHPDRLDQLPLSFMEFGMLGSPSGAKAPLSSETGAFGGAWRLAASAAAVGSGISEIFRWGAWDELRSESDSLLLVHSNLFLAALANTAQAQMSATVVLTAAPEQPKVACSTGGLSPLCRGSGGSCCVLPRSTDPGNNAMQSDGPASTSDVIVSGFATQVKSGGQGKRTDAPSLESGVQPLADGDILVLLSIFSTGRDNRRAVAPVVSFPSFGTGAVLDLEAAYVLNMTTSPFDVIHADASAHAGWLAVNDSAVRGLTRMLTKTGQAAVAAQLPRFAAAQEALLTPVPVPGAVGSADCSSSPCVLRVNQVAPPAVLGFVLRASAAQGTAMHE